MYVHLCVDSSWEISNDFRGFLRLFPVGKDLIGGIMTEKMYADTFFDVTSSQHPVVKFFSCV